mgnify:CR=1 FL=1
MTEPQKHSNKPPRDRAGMLFGIRPVEWLVAALLGAGSGLATAVNTIRDRFHDDVKKSPIFAPVMKANLEELNAMEQRTFPSEKAFRLERAAIKARHAETYDTFVKEHWKVDKTLISGTIQRWETLSPNSKYNIKKNCVIGMTIGAAMALSFFNSIATRDKIDTIEEAVNKRER